MQSPSFDFPNPRKAAHTGTRTSGDVAFLILLMAIFCRLASGEPVFQQTGSTLVMSNVNVVVNYNLENGTANFLWQNSLILNGFYSGVDLTTYVTGTVYSNHTWSAVSSNEVMVTSTANTLPTMKQYFILDQSNSFLTRVEMDGTNLSSSWMGPIVVSTTGGVDIGSYNNDIALEVPFDNDHFVTYNAESINNTGNSSEVAAFYDNTTRIGLVVGSVTHDTWKTGIYFSGSNNKLNAMNVYGGAPCPYDVMGHGPVTGSIISSPIVFVGFGPDWRTTIESFANENAAMIPKLPWTNGVPFGWNSWGVIQTKINYGTAVAVSDCIHTNLQPYNFENNGTVYVNLDSYWDNLNSTQLQDFVNHCHGNGQKAGIYWAPFVWWGAASNVNSSAVEGSGYLYSDILLRDGNGNLETNDGAIALDPTHPGTKDRVNYFVDQFLGYGFDYIKLDFLTHGALEGVHYDPNVTTGIQAYNEGMQYVFNQINGTMFISESIAPIFPYQYGNSRRIACDAETSLISNTSYTLNSVTYGWWMSGRIYQYNDPDIMVFNGYGATADENQSRLISGAITGLFLDGDSMTNAASQNASQTCLTNAAINALARNGQTFRPVEGDTGTAPASAFTGQIGTNRYIAVFNYDSSAATATNDLARAGIPPGTTGAIDLWSGAFSAVASNTLIASLSAQQARLFQLVVSPMFAVSATPSLQVVRSGGTTNFTVNVTASTGYTDSIAFSAAGLPAGASALFNPPTIGGPGTSTLTVTVSNATTSGSYPLTITGTGAGLTNSAPVTLVVERGAPADLSWSSTSSGAWDFASSNWFNLGSGKPDQFYPGDMVLFDDTAGVVTSINIASGVAVTPAAVTNNSSANNFTLTGAGTISGTLSLVKAGASTLTLGTANNFSGTVNVQSGTLKLAAASALGETNNPVIITNGGTLDLGGYGIGLQGLTVSGAGTGGNGAIINSGGPVYDNGNGLSLVTLAADATFGGPTRWDFGGTAGAVLSTGGKPLNVTIAGTSAGIYFEWMNLASDSALSNINIMARATLGDKGTTTLGNPAAAVNVFSNGNLTFYNNGSQSAVLNKKVVLYDGGTIQNGGGATVILSPVVLNTNAAGAPGNCTFNAGSTSLTASNVISGSGNLVKIGGSPLKLAGTNTYTGATMVNAGRLSLIGSGTISNSSAIVVSGGATLDVSARTDRTLTLAGGQTMQGAGVINGSVIVNSGATLSPGASGFGTLTVTNAVTLQGTTSMTLQAGTNSVLAAESIHYGGTLNVALGAGIPTTGSAFQLFSAPSYSGGFASIVPRQPGLGLQWNTSSLITSGTLAVAVLPRPTISGVRLSGSNVIFQGTNGTPGYSCRLLVSTNLTQPPGQWVIVSTNIFDGSGGFSVTNAAGPPVMFYSIQAL